MQSLIMLNVSLALFLLNCQLSFWTLFMNINWAVSFAICGLLLDGLGKGFLAFQLSFTVAVYLDPERNLLLPFYLGSISSEPTWLLRQIFFDPRFIIFCLLNCMALTQWVTLSIKNHLICWYFYLILYHTRWDDTRFVEFEAILSISAIKLF